MGFTDAIPSFPQKCSKSTNTSTSLAFWSLEPEWKKEEGRSSPKARSRPPSQVSFEIHFFFIIVAAFIFAEQ